MSTFDGHVEHFPNIAIDQFEGEENLASKAFFLSHCHQDHMKGLSSPAGLPGPLYASPVSTVLVKKLFPTVDHVVPLEVGKPTTIHLTESFLVTPIPAGHCPGSVMFLFQSSRANVLYTGDFRLRRKDIQAFSALRSSGGVINLDVLYLDSTFFHEDYHDFPTQFQSTDETCRRIKEWTDRGRDHKVILRISARFGYEYIFTQIADRLRQRVHVNAFDLAGYRHFPELDRAVTSDPRGAQIHAHQGGCNTARKVCGCGVFGERDKVRIIRLSAMLWRNWSAEREMTAARSDEFFQICYSTHASYAEIKECLEYLRPRRVELNVLPAEETAKRAMVERLRRILDGIRGEGSEQEKEDVLLATISFERSLEEVQSGSEKRLLVEALDEEIQVRELPKRKKFVC